MLTYTLVNSIETIIKQNKPITEIPQAIVHDDKFGQMGKNDTE